MSIYGIKSFKLPPLFGVFSDVIFFPGGCLQVPQTHPLLAPILALIPLQFLAYHAAIERGCDVDQPRNLAKSVTVE